MMNLKVMENLGLVEQINAISGVLEENGFTCEEIVSRGNHTFTYLREDVDVVFSVMQKVSDDSIAYSFMDKDIYESKFKGLPLSYKSRNDRKNKVICSANGFNNACVHRMVLDAREGMEVDHKTHNTMINLREYLRECTALENKYNRCCRSIIEEGKYQFKLKYSVEDKEERQLLQNMGYTVLKNFIRSKEFETETGMYQAIEALETMLMGEFRYNPVEDYSETWYAFALYRVAGLISKEELDAYNIDYFKRNKTDIAKYYLVA